MNKRVATCACQSVELELRGDPIVCAVCYCDDCQAGARQIEALPNAIQVLDADGGCNYVLFRKDRVRFTKGTEVLRNHKLREKSPTNRVVATCCNTALCLTFDRGPHWVTVFRSRISGEVPPLQMRTNVRFRPQGPPLPADAPSYHRVPVSFVWKLLASWAAMLFGR